MGQVISYLISQAETDLDIISVDDPYVEITSYADLRPPIVLIGISHFRRLNDATQLLQLNLPSEDVAIEISKQMILSSLADCFILRDNEELAVRSYALSILGSSSFYAPAAFEHLFEDQISVKELIFQYYGLAHEIGHCARARHAINRTWLHQELDSTLAEYLAQAKGDPRYDEARAQAVFKRMTDFFRSSVSKSGVEEEVSADLFAVECLLNIGLRGWRADYDDLISFLRDFAQSLFICMNAVSVSERIQQFARLTSQSPQPSSDSDEWLAYSFMSSASAIRAYSAFRFVARLISLRAAPPQSDHGPFLGWYEVLTDAIESYQSRVEHLDLGLTRARGYLLATPDDTFRLIEAMRHYHKIDERLNWMTELFIERVRERIPSSGRYIGPLEATLCQEHSSEGLDSSAERPVMN
jgi:hypothetical protein